MMKKNLILAFLLLFCTKFVSAEIKNELYNDKASYRAFLDLGKTYCLDTLMKQTKMYRIQKKDTDLFAKHFDTLYFLQSALAYIYRDTDMKKVFAAYQKQHIGALIGKYRGREEYFNINRSPFLICGKLFAESETTKKLYRDFLYAPGHRLNLHPESVKQLEERVGRWHDNPQPLLD